VYTRLQAWTDAQAAGGRLPSDAPRMLQEAWRLEAAGDRPNASKAWVRLRVLLASGPSAPTLEAETASHPRALSRLLAAGTEGPDLPEEEMGAALVQFARQMEKRN
jgi:hypothetical protein